MKKALEDAEQDPLVAVAGGGGLNLYNSMGSPWTADYLKVSGELDVDLRNNIAAEARAKITYERLMHLTDDQGSKDALQFLMTREITHMKAFSAALESLGKDPFSIGKLPPTSGLVNEYYNDSTENGTKRPRSRPSGSRRTGSTSSSRPSRSRGQFRPERRWRENRQDRPRTARRERKTA